LLLINCKGIIQKKVVYNDEEQYFNLVKDELYYKGDIFSGLLIVNDRWGNWESESEIFEGKINGYKRVYLKSGKLDREIYYVDDIPNGESRSFYENGKIETEGVFKDDKLDGIQKAYNNSGELIRKEKYKNKKLIYREDFPKK